MHTCKQPSCRKQHSGSSSFNRWVGAQDNPTLSRARSGATLLLSALSASWMAISAQVTCTATLPCCTTTAVLRIEHELDT